MRAAAAATGDPAVTSASASTVPTPAGEVTAVRLGSRVVYRYKDAEGHTVLVDQPPPGYAATKFENMPAPVADAPEAPDATTGQATSTAPARNEGLIDRLLQLAPWIGLVALLAGALVWLLPRLLEHLRRRLARRQSLRSVLDRSGYETMHGVILPLAGGRTAFFDHIVRTPSGLLVVGAERERAGEPHAVSRQQPRSATTHDLGLEVAKLDERVEAVKALAPGVPVFGRFVCTGNAPADGASMRVIALPRFEQTLPEFRRYDA